MYLASSQEGDTRIIRSARGSRWVGLHLSQLPTTSEARISLSEPSPPPPVQPTVPQPQRRARAPRRQRSSTCDGVPRNFVAGSLLVSATNADGGPFLPV